MRVARSSTRVFWIVFLCSFCVQTFGLTLEELRSTPDLTPRKFAAFFRDFEYKFRAEVQSPEVFLATRSGDCDDYATLADTVLRERGYTPRLITVRMPGVTHVVCYIPETGFYLDYNYRAFFSRVVKSGPSLPEIADQVARSYQARWTSVSEFTFENGLNRLVRTVVEPRRDEKTFAGLFR